MLWLAQRIRVIKRLCYFVFYAVLINNPCVQGVPKRLQYSIIFFSSSQRGENAMGHISINASFYS